MVKKKTQKNIKPIWIVIALIIVVAIALTFYSKSNDPLFVSNGSQNSSSFDFGNQTFGAGGLRMKFKNGTYSYTSNVTGNKLTGTIAQASTSPSGQNGAAIITSNPGGIESGTLYYLVGAIKKNNKVIYSSTEALGDRIIIQSLTVTDPSENNNGIVTVRYLDRKPNEPMSTEPSVETIKKFAFTSDGYLIEMTQPEEIH